VVDPRLKLRIEAYYRAFNARDEAAYLASFHPDGATGGTLTGQPAAGVGVQRALLRTASGSLGDLHQHPKALYQAQDEVAVAWEGEVKPPGGGPSIPVEGISQFRFDGEARITWLRVFWDPKPLSGKAGKVEPALRGVIEAYFRAFNGRDWDTLAALFAEGGLFGGTLAGPGLRGEASLRAIYESAVSRFPGIRMEPGLAFQAQTDLAVHWSGAAGGQDGRVHAIRGISLFDFDPGGRITRYRIYWDPRALLQEA